MRNKHIDALDESIKEIYPLSKTTSAPASIQYQYIGTLVDNTLVLLTGVANALDSGHRSIQFSDFDNWLSVMQAVHRSFYGSLIICIEKGLKDFCEEAVQVKSSKARRAESIVEGSKLNKEKLPKAIIKLLKEIARQHPEFMDYVGAVVGERIESNRQGVWISFFDSLRIVRNKASHSDPSLSSSEIEILKKGGMEALVSANGELQLNSRNYKPIIDYVLQFYNEASLDK